MKFIDLEDSLEHIAEDITQIGEKVTPYDEQTPIYINIEELKDYINLYLDKKLDKSTYNKDKKEFATTDLVSTKLEQSVYLEDKETFATKDLLDNKVDISEFESLSENVLNNTQNISSHLQEYSDLKLLEAEHHLESITALLFNKSVNTITLDVYKGGSQSPDHVDMPTMSDSSAGVVTPAQWAEKANVSDLSTYETTSHASSTYATKDELSSKANASDVLSAINNLQDQINGLIEITNIIG